MPVESERRRATVSEPTRPAADQLTSIVTTRSHAAAGLDWQAFSAAYFPERRRHDLEALAAYGAYRRSNLGTVPSSAERARIAPDQSAIRARALRDWEDEGGTTPPLHGP
jgi:hypothetical protein